MNDLGRSLENLMIKVKIVKALAPQWSMGEQEYEASPEIIEGDGGSWDEIEEGDLPYLKRYIQKVNKVYMEYKGYSYIYILLIQDNEIPDPIAMIHDIIEQERKEAAAQEEKFRLQKLKSVKLAEERKRKQLEKLKKELGEV